MRATVRSLETTDGDDLDGYVPNDPGVFAVWIRMLVGPAGMLGEESFDLAVCNPAWLEREVHEHGPLVGRHHLIVARWDAQEVWRYLTAIVESQEGKTWWELAERIARIGMWEFEDYRP